MLAMYDVCSSKSGVQEGNEQLMRASLGAATFDLTNAFVYTIEQYLRLAIIISRLSSKLKDGKMWGWAKHLLRFTPVLIVDYEFPACFVTVVDLSAARENEFSMSVMDCEDVHCKTIIF
jgi:hypothetical protein